MITQIRTGLEARDLVFASDADGALTCDTGIGLLRFSAEDGSVAIRVEAPSRNEVFMLRESVLAQLEQLGPALVAGIEWQGAEFASPYPPNFRVAQIVGCTQVSARFLRLRLEAEDLGDFARSGLHLRLLLPPAGREPVWPSLGPDGRTHWPTGADRLHTPPYTIRRIDPGAGWLDVDVFLHGNGPTCTWAKQVSPGATVGMTGPGGGWYPQADDLILAGDETALPAIARMLEAAAPETTGKALIAVEDAGDRGDLQRPPGVEVVWIERGKTAQPLVGVLKEIVTRPGPYVWFAAEKAEAALARDYLRETVQLDRKACHVAGYWAKIS
ncbi:SIP domain-containing protein [Halovulum dunhuangense]|uniref:SIP domain-containing protein n=1 Tax=Halovulum dunhuangense TaxID=1505036 RepID=A0A849L6W0_9RHOB|nr:SIP domain-containing protein [Halovulum dunhuangense]NNU82146.1 SIP domain-containing protein [Halovulum dunhuangense]